MQLNEILNKLMIALPIVTVVSCSSNQDMVTNHLSDDIIGANSIVSNNESDNLSYKDYTSLQIQQLMKNNIVFFALNKYDILSEFNVILDTHAKFLNNNPSYKVIIEGHADERGTPEYNIALGERRANAVKMYLQSRGVSANQISIISYGEEKPAVIGHNELAYAKNRRAILVY